MNIPVYLKSENPEKGKASHSASKALANLVVLHFAARWTSDTHKALQLTTCETWKQVKARVRPSATQLNRFIPKLLPPGPDCNLDLSYPARGMETVRHPHAAMRKACLDVRSANKARKQAERTAAQAALEALQASEVIAQASVDTESTRKASAANGTP